MRKEQEIQLQGKRSKNMGMKRRVRKLKMGILMKESIHRP